MWSMVAKTIRVIQESYLQMMKELYGRLLINCKKKHHYLHPNESKCRTLGPCWLEFAKCSSRTSEEYNTFSDNPFFLAGWESTSNIMVSKDGWESLGCEMFSGVCSLYCPDHLVWSLYRTYSTWFVSNLKSKFCKNK